MACHVQQSQEIMNGNGPMETSDQVESPPSVGFGARTRKRAKLKAMSRLPVPLLNPLFSKRSVEKFEVKSARNQRSQKVSSTILTVSSTEPVTKLLVPSVRSLVLRRLDRGHRLPQARSLGKSGGSLVVWYRISHTTPAFPLTNGSLGQNLHWCHRKDLINASGPETVYMERRTLNPITGETIKRA
jgi:hypothetical protein